MRETSNQKSISFITLGCAKNEVDTVHMRERVLQAGYTLNDDPSFADAIVVNTCSFIQAATEESIETVLDVAGLSSVHEGRAKLVIAGCMPSRYGDALQGEFPEAKAFVPCSQEDCIVEVLDDLFGAQASLTSNLFSPDTEGRVDPSVYVKISDGCDRFCSFCTIPFIRGRYHSFPFEDIACEVENLIGRGAREIVLIAQDTGRWGSDFEVPSSLAYLLDTLAGRFSDTWFRVMYLQPEGITPELLEVINRRDNVCSYLDMPIQHVDPLVLKAMNRKGDADEIRSLVGTIRSTVKGITLRTTLIAGFPGETSEAFQDLCDFIEEIEFDYVGVFPYSREEGTKAASMVDQVDEDTKLERTQILRDIADGISASLIAARVGERYEVLVLGREEDGQLYGRAPCQAPDVDGVTYLERGEIGEFRCVAIEDTLLYEMEGA